MYSFKRLLQITFLLFTSLTLAIIPWIPSFLIENIVNFMIVGLFILAGYLAYLLVKKLYENNKKKNLYITAMYSFLLFTYMGLFAILQIGVSLSKSEYIQTYTFGKNIFYTYKTDKGETKVSMKEGSLPIRSLPIATSFYMPIILKKKENYLYALGEGVNEKVYDFKNNISITNIINKEKND